MYFGDFTKTWNIAHPSSGTQSNVTLTFTYDEIYGTNGLFAQVKNLTSAVGRVVVSTKYNGVDVNDGKPVPTYDPTFVFTAYVTDSEPTFSGSGVTYSDINTTTANITASTSPVYIIQNKSKLRVTIPLASRATSKNHATMVRYEAHVAGKVVTANYSSSATVNIDVNEINSSSNTTLQLYAVDSRGLSTAVPLTVHVIPYTEPSIISTATRKDNFGTTTTITLRGTISPLNIGGSNKNSVVTAQYQYKVQYGADSSYTTPKNFSTSGVPNYTAANLTEEFPLDSSYTIRITVTDKLGTTVVHRDVSAGIPLVFIDSGKNSVGINQLPQYVNSFEIGGSFHVSGPANLNGDVNLGGWLYGEGKQIHLGNGRLFSRLGSERIPRNANLNNYTVEGLYYNDANADVATMTNTPSGYAFSLLVERHAGVKQTLTEYLPTSSQTFVRNYYSGTGWSSWLKYDVLVSEGSNSWGTFLRYASGIQICHYSGTQNVALNQDYAKSGIFQNSWRWWYPGAFAGDPAVSVSEMRWGTSASWGAVASKTSDYADLRGLDMFNRSSGSTYISAIAIGRWK
jgi:hypothetical protein